MKKKKFNKYTASRLILGVLAFFIVVVTLTLMTGCGNHTVLDTVYHFDRAIVHLPSGKVVEGEVQSWSDYENSDQIQVKIDGITYLIHSSDVVLIAE